MSGNGAVSHEPNPEHLAVRPPPGAPARMRIGVVSTVTSPPKGRTYGRADTRRITVG